MGESFRNYQYPLNWDEIFEYVKFPAFLKPHDGGGWRDVYHVHNPDEFFHAYDQTRDLAMTLQAAVNFNEYFRCYVVGQEDVHIMPYDPRQPHHLRYVQDPPEYAPELLQRVETDALTLCQALGYDLNTVEFAVEDGVPYAIDFMNPAPDADYNSVGATNFTWIVKKVADLCIKKAQGDVPQNAGFHWSRFLSGGVVDLSTSSGADLSRAGQNATGMDQGSLEDATGAGLVNKAPEKKAVRASAKKGGTRKG